MSTTNDTREALLTLAVAAMRKANYKPIPGPVHALERAIFEGMPDPALLVAIDYPPCPYIHSPSGKLFVLADWLADEQGNFTRCAAYRGGVPFVLQLADLRPATNEDARADLLKRFINRGGKH